MSQTNVTDRLSPGPVRVAIALLSCLGMSGVIGPMSVQGARPEERQTLLLGTEIGDLGDRPTAEQVVAALNVARSGIFKFRITPSLFGEPVEAGETFDAFIKANQDLGLAYFHNLGPGTVQIYLPQKDAIETSVPLSEKQWPTLEFALANSVQSGPGSQWPASYEAGAVRMNGTSEFNQVVGDLVENLRATELPEVLVFPLKYATADDSTIDLGSSGGGLAEIKSEGVKKQLERFLFGAVDGSKNKILAHRKQNAIMIVDRPETREYYQSIIDKLDQPRELVEITAAIIDIEAATSLEWQSHFIGAARDSENGGTLYGAGLGAGNGFGSTDPPPELPLPGLVNSDPGLNLATMLVGQHYRVISKIRALEGLGKAKVMSRPSVLSIENQPARITDTVTAYVPVRGERQSQLYDITSGISMTVLPRIVDRPDAVKDGRRVYLAIDVGDGDIGVGGDGGGEEGNEALQTNNRITTQAILRDGESLLIGGRYINQQSDTDTGVPILKRIPILGLPFKDKTVQNGRLQRLYLITPRILTWKEAQIREQEAAEMVGEAELARQLSIDEAAAVATGSALEYKQVPPGISPSEITDESTGEKREGRRRLFKGKFLRRLRER
ncbi:MAG: secretin N-terminal domain-containing protein [Verrucomicrobiales bacterium]